MSALVTEHLPLLASAPEGIKKLRGLILELAVRGKLVPQDPADEPAGELLKRIAGNEAELASSGKKKRKVNDSGATVDVSLEIPSGWSVTTLGDVVEIVRGITFPASEKAKVYDAGRVACLRTANVQSEIEWSDLLYIPESYVSRDDQYLMPHDIVMSMANSRELVGKVALVGAELEQTTTFGGFLGVLRPRAIEPRFVMAFLRAPATRANLIDSASQTTNIANVSLGKLRPLSFAVPPLAEQRRIVAKVDELMALCDRLEAQQGDAAAAHAQLVQALLDSLTQAPDADDFAASWQRLSAHFNVLFTTEASINALKQTILQLAVMGKLVPQDPTDEPVDELIGRVAKEIAKLYSEGKIRKPKPLIPVSAEDAGFEAPQGWMWLRLSQITRQIGDGLHGTPTYSQSGGYYFVNGNNLKDGLIVIRPETKSVNEAEYSKHKKPLDGQSILVSINGTIGNFAFYNFEKIILGKSACYLNLAGGVSKYFVRLLIEAPSFMEYASRRATGTTIKNLGLKAMNDYPVALPPLAEQRRIVAKVDELMALCDQLKTQLNAARQLHEKLASALVEQAVA